MLWATLLLAFEPFLIPLIHMGKRQLQVFFKRLSNYGFTQKYNRILVDFLFLSFISCCPDDESTQR